MQISVQTLQAADTQARWNKAIKDARAAAKEAGVPIKIRQNVMSCCRGCLTHEDLGLTKDSEIAVAYTFGGQGNRIQWRSGNPVTEVKKKKGDWYAKATLETEAYWNHENGSAPFLQEAFEANGFEVDWDGTDSQCVIVKFPEVQVAQAFHAIEVEGRVYVAKSKYGVLGMIEEGYSLAHRVVRFQWVGPLVKEYDLTESAHFDSIQALAVQTLVEKDIVNGLVA